MMAGPTLFVLATAFILVGAAADNTVTSNGTMLFVGDEPVREFTLFSAALRNTSVLSAIFSSARSLGYNLARVGSETADWPALNASGCTVPPTTTTTTQHRGHHRLGDSTRVFCGLKGPEPGSPAQIANLRRVVDAADAAGMALEVCLDFTIKSRPVPEQLAYVKAMAALPWLNGAKHVLFTGVNEPWVHSTLNTSATNAILRAIKALAPDRLLSADESGQVAPSFRYDVSTVDFVAYHWPRMGTPEWWTAPNLAPTVAHWNAHTPPRPVLLNEVMCWLSEANYAKYAPGPSGWPNWEYNRSKPLITELLRDIYAKGATGCYHSLWGMQSLVAGWMPPATF